MATVAYPEYAKVVTLPSGVTYSYTHIPAKDDKPTILFIHGFPSSSYDWRHQIKYFSSLGYGVIAPDLLGYGETDRPTAAADYRGKKMAGEVNELLDHANVSKVHGVAHDWGSYLLARLNTYHRERLLSSAFLATPYRVPGKSLNVDAINAMTKEKLGFEMLGYWKFFEKEDAGDIVKEHIESFMSLLYPEDGSVWKENMAPLGALEAFAKRDGKVPRGNYVTDEEVAIHRKIMKDEYGPAMNWYRCEMQNFNFKDEDGAGLNPNLDGPVLMAVAKGDALSNEPLINEMKQYAVNLKIVEIQSGHWIQLEKRDEVNAALKEHFETAEKL